MILEFSVKNFRSIREQVKVSLSASDESGHTSNLVDLPDDLGSVLKTAIIYGANASGKSNVLKAMAFVYELITRSHLIQSGDKIEVTPFRLDGKSEQEPSEFEVYFLVNSTEHCYGLSVTQERVLEEYLYAYPSGQETMIFERKDSNTYTFGEDVEKQKTIAEMTLDNKLYLSNATQFNYKPIKDVHDYFKNKVVIATDIEAMKWDTYTKTKLHEDTAAIDLARELLRNADTGIDDISITRRAKRVLVSGDDGKAPYFRTVNRPEVNSYHKYLDDQGVEQRVQFSLTDESKGTQRMFELLGPLIDALREGKVLVIDELESSLHPLLTEQLIQLFHNPEINTLGAQLVFTTHNTNLLNELLFRRDQVWFTEKDSKTGATSLYSLVDFKPRNNEDIEKGYLIGRYGAIPFFKGGSLL
ncbi:AAA family ATPase [Tumebacillus permanentifrigoris]|uniref:ATPase AAA-type core domain-containing protein n=1 Tax=Tumebacillus permanentifrigoris TaxID=378543 RepID=A0A316DGI3_9BACL|nr:ATP-binding protein [Tumebacillus permanentifrigoris]PWK16349.1 hypothetical protein C7459_101213 [Tumebacillus permanentifrigoris]